MKTHSLPSDPFEIVEMRAATAPGYPPCTEFYVYDRSERLVRVCPSLGMAQEVAAGI